MEKEHPKSSQEPMNDTDIWNRQLLVKYDHVRDFGKYVQDFLKRSKKRSASEEKEAETHSEKKRKKILIPKCNKSNRSNLKAKKKKGPNKTTLKKSN